MVLLHGCVLALLVACLSHCLLFPQFELPTDRHTFPVPATFHAGMDHGDLLRECRLMLHSMSSQISVLVAGLQRLEGQQRHPQPPPPPSTHDGQPPLPPPPTSAPPSLPAPSVRSTHPTVPITLVATSDNRMEPAGHVNPVSDSTSRERRRRRRSRHLDPHWRRSRSRSHHRRPLGRPAHTGSTSDCRTFVPKPPPAVKAMPACRPSGLSYDR